MRYLVALAAALAALAVSASAVASSNVRLTIRHQVHGCHAWAIGNSAYRASQTVKVKAGTALTFTNNDVMPHRLVQLAGPGVRLHNLPAPTTGMGLHGPFAPGMMGRMGASTRLVLTKPGTYRFTTRAGEDYMAGMKTIGEDNVLRLTVTVT